MRIGVVADPHVGNHRKLGGEVRAGLNDRCRLVLETLSKAAEVAHDLEVDAFIVAGDLFDTARPPPQMIAAAQQALEEVPAILLVGNHDRSSDAPGDHALGPLAPVAEIVEEPRIISPVKGWDLLCLPFMPGNARDYFAEEVAKLAAQSTAKCRLLFFHLGVQDASTPEYLKGARDSIHIETIEEVMEENKILYAFAGNWHDHKHWYVIDGKHGVVQCGTLAPTGWDNHGVDGYGSLVVFDSDAQPAISIHEIPGPRFLTVRGPSAVDTIVASANKDGHTVYCRWKATLSNLQTAQEELAEWKASGAIAGGEVLVDDEEAEAGAREAARVARKAETLGEALAKFVAEMPLEEGIDRGEVLSRAQGYLGGA